MLLRNWTSMPATAITGLVAWSRACGLVTQAARDAVIRLPTGGSNALPDNIAHRGPMSCSGSAVCPDLDRLHPYRARLCTTKMYPKTCRCLYYVLSPEDWSVLNIETLDLR